MNRKDWPSTHVSLVHALRDPQNEGAWNDFVQDYRDGIVKYCRLRFAVSEEEADELAQETLLKLIQAIRSFRFEAKGSFRGWLSTVTRHAVLDLLAKEKRRPDVAAGGEQDFLIDGIPNRTDELADQISNQLRMDLLKQAEHNVRPKIRNPSNWDAYSRTKHGERSGEVAADLGMAVAAVYKARSRIIEMIRVEIARMLSCSSRD